MRTTTITIKLEHKDDKPLTDKDRAAIRARTLEMSVDLANIGALPDHSLGIRIQHIYPVMIDEEHDYGHNGWESSRHEKRY